MLQCAVECSGYVKSPSMYCAWVVIQTGPVTNCLLKILFLLVDAGPDQCANLSKVEERAFVLGRKVDSRWKEGHDSEKAGGGGRRGGGRRSGVSIKGRKGQGDELRGVGERVGGRKRGRIGLRRASNTLMPKALASGCLKSLGM